MPGVSGVGFMVVGDLPLTNEKKPRLNIINCLQGQDSGQGVIKSRAERSPVRFGWWR